MTKPPSPFAGVKLSDLVSTPSPGPLDQQLFRPSQPPAPPSAPVQQETPQEHKDVKTSKRQNEKTSLRQDPKTSFGQDVNVPRHQNVNASSQKDVNVSRQQEGSPYDINDETLERETVRVSKAEQRAIERLKLSLRDLLDSTVGKNDIFRAGLHSLLEDFHTNGEQSEIVARLRKKTK
jgi:hypothetical protein